MSKYYGQFGACSLPACCGFLEIGGMNINVWGSPEKSPAYVYGDTQKEVAEEMLKKIRDFDTAKFTPRPLIFNFRDNKGNKKFVADALRKLIMEQEDYQFVAEYTNPNTGNTIFSCVLLNNCKVVAK